ncbi:MAG: cyclopropane fatty acyl phospholipid synthase [Candidatus Paceibacterota bacterium]
MSSKHHAQTLLKKAGITIGGDKPYDIIVSDERFYNRVFSQGSLGLGEAYMEGWWDVKELDQFFAKVFSAELEKEVRRNATILIHTIKAKFFNRQSATRAFQVGEEHTDLYDIGNDLYRAMLDTRMVYSCGYWKRAQDLDEAQEHKLDLVCRKLQLKKGERVLDIGCGWGSFAKYAAENYGVEVVGITISKEQAHYAREVCKGLAVKILLEDYRKMKGEYDKIVSIGMFEHVGYKNYHTFMHLAHSLLKPKGLFLLHTIGSKRSVTSTDPWINKYIFPNGMLPSIKQIGASIEQKFVMEDWHNFGADYDTTLMHWFKNFETHWEKLIPEYERRVGGMFYRMWKYYLLASAGSFRARRNQLWQVVLSKSPQEGRYDAVR